MATQTVPTSTQNRGRRMRGLALLALAAIVTGSIVTNASTPARAAVTGYVATVQYIGGGDYINVRSGPNRSSSIVGRLAPNTPISISCQTAGGQLGFGTYGANATWDRIDGPTAGYVSDVLTSTPGGARAAAPGGGYTAYSPNIGTCSTGTSSTRETRAADWARSQVGVVRDSGYCERFAEAAFGTTLRYGSADADYYAQQGRIHTDTNIPVGALVFYDVSPYGHVGVAVGQGMVVSTKSPVNGVDQPVRMHTVLGLGLGYRGWSYAPDSWTGR